MRSEHGPESGAAAPGGPLRVLVATDGSPGAVGAVRFALRLLETPADVRLVTVVSAELQSYGAEETPLSDAAERTERLRREEAHAFGEARRMLEAAGHRVSTVHRFGQPAAEVVYEAQVWGPDLVVAGRRGMGRATSLMLGSVSDRLLRNANVPVLIVP